MGRIYRDEASKIERSIELANSRKPKREGRNSRRKAEGENEENNGRESGKPVKQAQGIKPARARVRIQMRVRARAYAAGVGRPAQNPGGAGIGEGAAVLVVQV